MLERAQFKNFQRLKLLRIVFSPTVTTIVGKSRTGKSCAIRGLRWLCTNRPNTPAIQKHGTKQTSVNLWVDGHRIDRLRGESGQLYRLDGKEFKAFTTEVPREIAQLLNLDEINFQAQSDGPYWLFDSPGQVSQKLNAIVDLGVIDETLSRLAKRARKAKTVLEITTERLETARQTKKDLAFAVQMDTELQDVERLEKISGEKRSQIDSLALVCQLVSDAQQATKNAVVAASGAGIVLQAARDACRHAQKAAEIAILIIQIKELTQVTNSRPPDFTPVKTAAREVDRLADECGELSEIINQIKGQDEAKRATEKKLFLAHSQLEKVSAVCPLCGTPRKK